MLNSWRPKRDKDDWKMSNKTWLKCLMAQLDNGSISDAEFENELNLQTDIGGPSAVTASTRLGDDVRALMAMFDSPTPPEVNLRSKEIITVVYGFGDASGTGLGERSPADLDLIFASECGALMTVVNHRTGESSPI